MVRFLSVLLIVMMVLGSASAQAKLIFPELTGRVVDNANVLSPDTTSFLNERLAEYEQQTGHQIVVATLNDIGGTSIEDYGYQLGRYWQVGRKDKNDGVLILLVPSERSVRIEVGYGLEAVLTDAASALIIQRIMIPNFKNGDLQSGLKQGVLAVISILEGDPETAQRLAQTQHQDNDWVLVFWIIVLILMIYLNRRNRWGMPIIMGSGLGRGGRSGGFTFRGGGGSFGGGGASGRW